MLSDWEIIEKFKIKEGDRVLDIGGSMKQHDLIRVDTLVDLIRPEEAPYTASKLLARKYVRVDVTKEKLPFADKEYDFCLCTHTLEDLYNPFLLLDEMPRVAKRGLVTTPSMGKDMVYSRFDITNWMTGVVRTPGLSHHKWFFVKEGKLLKIIPKNYGILFSSQFHLVRWIGADETNFYWQNKIEYMQVSDLNIHDLIDEYIRYLSANKAKYKKGTPVVFTDNPLVILKAYTKLILKKGKGFKLRKSL